MFSLLFSLLLNPPLPLLLLLLSALLPYCLLLKHCSAQDLPLPPILDGETDAAPRPVHARSSLIRIDLIPQSHHQLQQATHNQNSQPWRSQQVTYLSIPPVLSQSLRLSLRLRLNLYHYFLTFSRSYHFLIFSSYPLAMPQTKLPNSHPRHTTTNYLTPILRTKSLISRHTCTPITDSTRTLTGEYIYHHTHILVLHNYKYDSVQQTLYTLVQNPLPMTTNISAPTSTNRTTKTRTALLTETLLTLNSQTVQTKNNPTTIFIIKLHNKNAIYQTTNTNNQTVRILLDILYIPKHITNYPLRVD